MQICKVYSTSKGLFWNKKHAEQLENRVHRYSHPFEPHIYEPVKEAFVMMARVGDKLEVFQMFPAEVK